MKDVHRARPVDADATLSLLVRAQAGDEAALSALVRNVVGPLSRFAHGRLPAWGRQMVDTEDVVQETVFRSIRNLDHFEARHSGAFHAYLRAGVLNRIREEIRRVARQPQRGGTAAGVADDQPSPVEEVIGREAVERYETALARLRPVEREAIVARVELRLPYAEIAQVLGKTSADAARMAVSRAILRLAREMADDG